MYTAGFNQHAAPTLFAVCTLQEGDVLLSNHPQLAGGSHLPDITVITPVFNNGDIVFFVASRGHHADIGGISPGSMPPSSTCLEEEGAAVVSFKLVKGGLFQVRAPESVDSWWGRQEAAECLWWQGPCTFASEVPVPHAQHMAHLWVCATMLLTRW